jgi:hypothetical protein
MRSYPEKYGNGVTILHIAGAKVLENTYRNATYNASRRCNIIDGLKDADLSSYRQTNSTKRECYVSSIPMYCEIFQISAHQDPQTLQCSSVESSITWKTGVALQR